MRSVFLILTAGVALSACRPSVDRADSTEALAEAGATESGPSARGGNPIKSGAEKATPVTLPDNLAIAEPTAATEPANTVGTIRLPTQIPDQFHGRWALVRADCISTRGDAKGLLTITDARLTFYEARGTLEKVLSATANSFDGEYGFTGEGMEWRRVERLKLVNDKLQRRTDPAVDQSEPPVNLTYSRCPA